MNISSFLQHKIYKVFRFLVKPFLGTGLGRYRIIGSVYRFLSGFLIPEEQRIVDVNGYKILVHTQKYKGIDGISQQLLFQGTYDPCSTQLYKRLIKKGMHFIDVGANIGYFTLLAANLVGEKGKVIAFEPEPRNFDLLLKNIEINDFVNIVAYNKAVSNLSGTINLFIDEVEPGAHSILKVRDSARSSILIDTISLDTLLCESRDLIHAIKVDVEGAEILVLEGMKGIIEANDEIILFTEYWPTGLEKAGFAPSEYWHKLRESGFKYIYHINENNQSLQLANLESILSECKSNKFIDGTSVNLLCSKQILDLNSMY